jgi:hypothetical protein
MHDFIVFLFAIAVGMTASGLIASIYRLTAGEPKTTLGTAVYYAVMVVAGPAVLAGNSTKSFRKKQCSKAAYAVALALSGYWSFAMGVYFLAVFLALHLA